MKKCMTRVVVRKCRAGCQLRASAFVSCVRVRARACITRNREKKRNPEKKKPARSAENFVDYYYLFKGKHSVSCSEY